jgi:hypothetical protein
MYERLGFKPVKSVDTPRMAQAFGDEYDALVFMERALLKSKGRFFNMPGSSFARRRERPRDRAALWGAMRAFAAAKARLMSAPAGRLFPGGFAPE